MQPSVALDKEIGQMETLISRLKAEGGSELLIEHLQTAAAYRHGAMPGECAHNLEMARVAAGGLASKSLAQEVRTAVDSIMQDLHPHGHTHWRHHTNIDAHVPRPTANGLEEFFHGTDLSLGMFYPKKHVVAVFRSFHDAQFADYRLWAAGFRGWEAIAAPGYEVDEFLGRIHGKQSLWARLAVLISRVLDTEAGLTDRYVRWARHGAGFVVAYSPTEEQAIGIEQLLAPLRPLDMHWFTAGYIRDLL